jgi:hypothetical protein
MPNIEVEISPEPENKDAAAATEPVVPSSAIATKTTASSAIAGRLSGIAANSEKSKVTVAFSKMGEPLEAVVKHDDLSAISAAGSIVSSIAGMELNISSLAGRGKFFA